jgi:hypothetical protein
MAVKLDGGVICQQFGDEGALEFLWDVEFVSHN